MTSEARLLINVIVVGTGELLFIGSCVFALAKGGLAERLGATIFGAAGLGTALIEMLTHQGTPVIGELFIDTAEALGFLALAIRYNNLWLGAAMMVKGVQLAVHATHLTDGEDPYWAGFNLYAASLNLLSIVTCLSLIAATIAAIRARIATRRRASEPAPPLELRARRAEPRLARG